MRKDAMLLMAMIALQLTMIQRQQCMTHMMTRCCVS